MLNGLSQQWLDIPQPWLLGC